MHHVHRSGNALTPQSLENSLAAYRSVEADLPILRERVLVELRRAGTHGRTDHELTSIIGGNADSIRPRRVRLVHDGIVVASGRSRPTPSGRQATVWVLREYRTSATTTTSAPDAGGEVADAK